MDSDAAVEAFVDYLKHQRLVVDYVFVSAIALLLYDYFLTLYLEVSTIWFTRWTYTKVLFLLVRYLPMISITLMIRDQLKPDIPVKSCQWSFPVLDWLVMVGILLAECVLMIRTYAIWHRDRKVGFTLALLLITTLCTACYTNASFIKSMKISVAPYPGFRGCYMFAGTTIMRAGYITLTVSETVVLALMVINACRSYALGVRNPLQNAIHRDGILSYTYLLASTIVNLVVSFTMPLDFSFMISPVQAVLFSVLTSRIIFNIRTAARKLGSATELHGFLSELTASPLEFRMEPITQFEETRVEEDEMLRTRAPSIISVSQSAA